MIVDSLNNSKLYFDGESLFGKGFEFIKKAVAENYPVGKYEIDGDKVYAMVQEYNTKATTEGRFEAHRKYADIQYVISGMEIMEYVHLAKVDDDTDYDGDKDIVFFKYDDPATNVVVSDGDFAVFMPEDVHKPGISHDGKFSPIKKIVVKVLV